MKQLLTCLIIVLLILCSDNLYAQQQGQHVLLLAKDSITTDHYSFRDLISDWRFQEGDDSSMANPGYNDGQWDIVNADLRYRQNARRRADTFSSIGWFRLHFIADTSITGIPLALKISQYGASEVYLDGRKLTSYGTIKGKDSTVCYDPQQVPLMFVIPTAGNHLLAVRYANYRARHSALIEHRDLTGFNIAIGEAQKAVIADHEITEIVSVVCALLIGFFFAFCIAHLFLYFYYRAVVSNLYFAIFCFCLAGAFLLTFLNRFATDPKTEIADSFIGLILLSVGCISFSGFTNHLFSVKKTRFRIITAACVFMPFLLMINNKYGFILCISLVLVVFVEATIITIRAIYKKVKGARIIGAGILFFTLFFLSNTVFAIIHGNDSVNGNTVAGQIYLALTACAIICMPVFMSLYLAWNYAAVNKNLKSKLLEVEQLSAQTIAQEQEKQRIAEGQKETLEREVAARTTEVVAQKEKIEKQHDELKTEKKKSDDLLLNILPAEIAEELKEKGYSKARLYNDVTVMFTDFVGFTSAGERMLPEELVNELDTCFKAFDEIISKYGIEKIKTIGDAYLSVCGLPETSQGHAVKVAQAAMEIIRFITERKRLHGDKSFDIRIGIHSGSVVAGIVGIKKFAYDIWGDTVNTAARMEQNSEAGKINISQTTYELVKDKFTCEYRGEIDAKNKGMLKMYYVNG